MDAPETIQVTAAGRGPSYPRWVQRISPVGMLVFAAGWVLVTVGTSMAGSVHSPHGAASVLLDTGILSWMFGGIAALVGSMICKPGRPRHIPQFLLPAAPAPPADPT